MMDKDLGFNGDQVFEISFKRQILKMATIIRENMNCTETR